jgi:RNA polymerase sigma factor (sigma-70 family)
MVSGQDEQETRDKVIHLLNQLTPRQRHAIYLHYFENLKFETIAQIMEMQVQSVRNSISRGLQAMRNFVLFTSFFILLDNPYSIPTELF